MTEPRPILRRQLELIALDTDRERQSRHIAIFSRLNPDTVLPKLAEYRHHMVMENPEQAQQIIADLLQQDQEARTS